MYLSKLTFTSTGATDACSTFYEKSGLSAAFLIFKIEEKTIFLNDQMYLSKFDFSRTGATDACSTFHEKSVLSAAFLFKYYLSELPNIFVKFNFYSNRCNRCMCSTFYEKSDKAAPRRSYSK